jgi:hypothetical protein
MMSSRNVLRVGEGLACALILSASSTLAQDSSGSGDRAPGLLEPAGITGSVRAGYWSSTRNLDPEDHLGSGMLWLKSAKRVSDRLSFLVEGWIAARGPLEDGDATGALREAFLELQFGRLDLRVGRQITAWGVRMVSIRPTT